MGCGESKDPRAAYTGEWEVGMCEACCRDPTCCALSALCPLCASYKLRERALHYDMTKYRCCQGYMGCGCCKCHDCGEDKCPEVCLACEVWCCFNLSVLTTRFTIQDEYTLMNTPCDNCLIATVACLHCLACILKFIPGVPDGVEDCVDFLADCTYCSVCACMQTQHKVEMDKQEMLAGGGSTTVVTTTTVITSQPGVPQYGATDAVTKQPMT